MIAREIVPGVKWVGAIDFGRRLFDALIPTPEGTSYNAYLVRGAQKTALIDTVEPECKTTLFDNLAAAGVDRLDYVVMNHAEQDHSGSLPDGLARYPMATAVTNAKCKEQLQILLGVAPERIQVIQDRETLDLGGKSLEFIFAPWVHWPETMFTYLREDRVLFSCDFLGSHLATTDLYADDFSAVYEPAKRYYAEIMMPFRKQIQRNLEKLESIPVAIAAPSHGPLHRAPEHIIGAYRDWASDTVRNEGALPYVSMHGSTARMVGAFTSALMKRGITVKPFELTGADAGRLAMALVDAATVVVASPTVLTGAHPLALYAAILANALKPKTRFISVLASFGWGGKAVEQLTGALGQLQAEVIPPVMVKGAPQNPDFGHLDHLADEILARHKSIGIA